MICHRCHSLVPKIVSVLFRASSDREKECVEVVLRECLDHAPKLNWLLTHVLLSSLPSTKSLLAVVLCMVFVTGPSNQQNCCCLF